MNAKYAVNLKKGDLILVNYPSGLYPAIYIKKGSRNNPNFILLMKNVLDYYNTHPSKKVDLNYIHRGYGRNIVRLHEMYADEETVELYNEYMKLLTEKGML